MYAYFFPFYFSERDSFIKSEGDYQRSKGIFPFFIDEYECDNLKVLNKCDRLYVIAHGNTAVIGDGVRGTKKLEPKDLAKLLCDAGLQHDFEDLRLFSCYSGVSKNFASYAQRLKEALKSLGYKDIHVTGYLGMVDCSRDFRFLRDGSDFYTKRTKGITPEKDLIKSSMCLSNDDILKYRASNFKVQF
ncbi:hypothetical protein AB2912_23945 [Escherichia coli]|uniref:hypothetical protein n=1 Tax=Escherichia coli TaxID=562 RepID=UPI0018C59499|nr:hypothetical protein [Escherichia coli]HDZ8902472.1 hypothetical protein [Escherichia coli]